MDYLYYLPILLEAINFKVFGIQPEGIPISLGFLFLLFLGIKRYDSKIYNDGILKSFLLIIAGLFISAFFSNTVINDLTRTIALTLGIISAIFFAKKVFDHNLLDKLIYFFAALNAYWIYYVQNLFLSGQVVSDYHFNSYRQGIETINSHTVGIAISTSGIFLFTYFFLDKKLFKNVIGFGILILSLYSQILIQTRSNVIFFLFVAAIVVLVKFNKKLKTSQLLLAGGLFVFVFFLLPQLASYFGGEDSAVSRRFNFEDDEYQESTTEMRRYVYIVFLKKLTTSFIGTGIVRPKLFLGVQEAQNLLMHNQYATYVVAGGWFSLLGVLGWIAGIVKYFKQFFFNIAKMSVPHVALNFTLLIYFITLSSVEQSDILFFIFLGFLICQNFYFLKNKTI